MKEEKKKKKEPKLSFFTNDRIVYIEDPKNLLLKLITEFSKTAEYKVNTQNSTIFLYGSNNYK